MATTISRRNSVKSEGGGNAAALVIGSKLPWVLTDPNYVSASVRTIKLEIGDAIKHMVTDNPGNDARCYFWIYKSVSPAFPPECPGPIIFAEYGDTVNIEVKNSLDEPHAFFIPGLVDSGPIAPNTTWAGSFVASITGTYMYYDNLNEPVNRVMGLHGAIHIHPIYPVTGHKLTPYAKPTPGVQRLFDDFGSSAHFPGLAWDTEDISSNPNTPPMRMYVWLDHQASPNLFQEVGSLPPGQIYDANEFVEAFLRDSFSPGNANRRPQYFTINGQPGHFSHYSRYICPNLRVGEPCVVHILNAGLWSHSHHIHANHVYVTFVDNMVQENPKWVDTFTVEPMDRLDYVVPFMRPPDVPNLRGIGYPDAPLTTLANPAIPGSMPHPAWPPTEEINMFIPGIGTTTGSTPVNVQLSPLRYPMHDHSEPSQSAQGGNYNLGLISGINFTGDRSNPADIITFPNAPVSSR